MNAMNAIMVILISTTILSCANSPPLIVQPVLPSQLILPKIEAEKLMCLDDETYHKLTIRDKLQTARRETLRDICGTK